MAYGGLQKAVAEFANLMADHYQHAFGLCLSD